MKKKTIKKVCEHLGWHNERDCNKDAEYICLCCAAGVCEEHKEKDCPYGGMSYIEV